MKTTIQLGFILLVVPAILSQEHEYCRLESCPDDSHTLCIFTNDGYGPLCRNNYNWGITDSEKTFILRIHNRWLNSSETETHDVLEWDQELADIAQRWAFQCIGRTDLCRNVGRFNVTQRFFARENLKTEISLLTAIEEWHSLENQGTTDLNHLSLGEATLVGEVRRPWGNANKIGCGKVRSRLRNRFVLFLICNFAHLKDGDDDDIVMSV